jgi:hypothetical protein
MSDTNNTTDNLDKNYIGTDALSRKIMSSHLRLEKDPIKRLHSLTTCTFHIHPENLCLELSDIITLLLRKDQDNQRTLTHYINQLAEHKKKQDTFRNLFVDLLEGSFLAIDDGVTEAWVEDKIAEVTDDLARDVIAQIKDKISVEVSID